MSKYASEKERNKAAYQRAKAYQKAYAEEHKDKLRAYRQEWHKKNYESKKAAHRARKLLANTGWTVEEFEAAWINQAGLCAICHEPMAKEGPMSAERVVADHDHLTMQPRALLHSRCNVALGGFLDRPDLLREAALYLESDHSDLREVLPATEKKITG